MKQPIPRGGTEPLKVGDRVQIVPEWQDPLPERRTEPGHLPPSDGEVLRHHADACDDPGGHQCREIGTNGPSRLKNKSPGSYMGC